MKQPEFGYISSDINHLTSIPLLVIMPLAILFAVCYWFRKKKKSIKEKEQSKWRLLPVGVVLCFSMLFSILVMGFYWRMNFEEPKCRKYRLGMDLYTIVVEHKEDLTNKSETFYDFIAYRERDFPWCPEDREAVERRLRIGVVKEALLEK